MDTHKGLADASLEAFIIGQQRSSKQDIEFLINQLKQVAAHASSPSLNNSCTAMTYADWLSAGIAHLATQEYPSSLWCSDGDRLCMISNTTLTFEGTGNTASTAFDGFRQSARPVASVTIRLLDAIVTIMAHISDENRLTVLKQQADIIEPGSLGFVLGK